MRLHQNVKLVVLAIAMALGVVAQAEAQGALTMQQHTVTEAKSLSLTKSEALPLIWNAAGGLHTNATTAANGGPTKKCGVCNS
ncbi:hypothetical protein shim_20800 [Shimia sp. SK013]|uniref:hypothetical protein n=1 Tax=Shimia sp. SK013 TaxID=1389006 RepID=UPI0006CC9DEA|nr:hypothetical protein [Shimia sp. SK013]KPA21376.1 hypothetical protein shim_20800 [Shimia sp. SK013]